jgi:hypothetical protein
MQNQMLVFLQQQGKFWPAIQMDSDTGLIKLVYRVPQALQALQGHKAQLAPQVQLDQMEQREPQD